MKQIPLQKYRFPYTLLVNWRDVPRDITIHIANACSSGVDFRGSSKSSVLDSMAGNAKGYVVNTIEFERRMSEAAKILRKNRISLMETLTPLLKKA